MHNTAALSVRAVYETWGLQHLSCLASLSGEAWLRRWRVSASDGAVVPRCGRTGVRRTGNDYYRGQKTRRPFGGSARQRGSTPPGNLLSAVGRATRSTQTMGRKHPRSADTTDKEPRKSRCRNRNSKAYKPPDWLLKAECTPPLPSLPPNPTLLGAPCLICCHFFPSDADFLSASLAGALRSRPLHPGPRCL